ncbi:MAG: anaerobic ribonucleoside-triphosphate reductase activating protein [Ruminococcus sp.]|nr:anaerobic ribonucleoside-triphosphate reductase activating protein [Ruminococcus sp.]
MQLRIAGRVGESIVDGPGIRYALFVQGCPHHCEGCHNPETWSFDGGELIDTDTLFEEITSDPLLDGVTYSGGEPFCQCAALAELSDKIRAFKGFPLNIISYTGFTFEELVDKSTIDNGYMELLKRLDILVDGRFVLAQRTLELPFRGSENQRYIDVQASLRSGVAVEVSPF